MLIEPLEPRIAPAATFVNATTATYTDVDGDLVTVKFTKSLLTAANIGSIFTMTAPAGAPSGGEMLTLLNLTGVAAAKGTGITLTATPQDATLGGVKDGVKDGDGFAMIGAIKAVGLDLGAISIRGDLAELDAGDISTPGGTAVASLKLVSFNRSESANGSLGVSSNLSGFLGSLTVTGDVHRVNLSAEAIGSITIGGSFDRAQFSAFGTIGAIKIGGSVIGHATDGPGTFLANRFTTITIGGSLIGGGGSVSSGIFESLTSMGAVKIGGSIEGHGDSGNGLFSGTLRASGTIASVTVGGSMFAEIGKLGAAIVTNGDIGAVKVAGQFIATTFASARIQAAGNIASVTIGGDLRGGPGGGSTISAGRALGPVIIGGDVTGGGTVQPNADGGGRISAGEIKSVVIGGDLIGGPSLRSGSIVAFQNGIGSTGNIGTVTVKGNVIGGSGESAGDILAEGTMASISIGHDLIGGSGPNTGSILASKTITKLAIGGDLNGGASAVATGETGQIRSNEKILVVTIGGDLQGGITVNSGRIRATGTLGSVTILGSLTGGAVQDTGELVAAGIGTVKIGADLRGGTGFLSGVINSTAGIASVTVGGSIYGGTASATGSVFATGAIAKINLAGSLFGGQQLDGSPTGALQETGTIRAGQLGTIFIGGSIVAGQDNSAMFNPVRGGAIQSDTDITSITVLGSLLGRGDGNGERVLITAKGQSANSTSTRPDIALGKLDVRGSVSFAGIYAGYDPGLNARNADAQIGSVIVGGDWMASDLIAGVARGADGVFGSSDDAKIPAAANVKDRDDTTAIAKIASVVIKGAAYGSLSNADAATYAIAAQHIVSLKVGGLTIGLQAGAMNDRMTVPDQAGLSRPLGATFGTRISDRFDFHALEVA